MFKKNIQQKIKKLTQEFFEKTSFEVKIEIGERIDFSVPVLIAMEDPQSLIGENGKTLFCIQHLLNKLSKKRLKDEQEFYLDLDINDYKKKKLSYLKDLARSQADDAAFSRIEKELRPMSAYERRIVHLELKDRSDIITESVGQDPERKIIIKPV